MPPPSPPSRAQILRTYRALYKTGLQAIRHAKPARYTLRDRLRSAFRSRAASDLDPDAVSRTLQFLENAKTYRGLEHKVLRNLLVVWGTRHSFPQKHVRYAKDAEAKVEANEAFDGVVRELNRTMGICI